IRYPLDIALGANVGFKVPLETQTVASGLLVSDICPVCGIGRESNVENGPLGACAVSAAVVLDRGNSSLKSKA
ncbi:MAG TPA: hypothetical protein VGN38_01515, partial [Caulobacteraceae bacterium]|nr:hypothetical protein [Caulobacteraceae bacterium]